METEKLTRQEIMKIILTIAARMDRMKAEAKQKRLKRISHAKVV